MKAQNVKVAVPLPIQSVVVRSHQIVDRQAVPKYNTPTLENPLWYGIPPHNLVYERDTNPIL